MLGHGCPCPPRPRPSIGAGPCLRKTLGGAGAKPTGSRQRCGRRPQTASPEPPSDGCQVHGLAHPPAPGSAPASRPPTRCASFALHWIFRSLTRLPAAAQKRTFQVCQNRTFQVWPNNRPENLLEQVLNVVRRAKAPHLSGGQSRPATVVPAVMLSIQLCGVRPENPCRITLLAKFTPHNSRAGPVSGTRAQRRFRLAGPLLRTFRLAARRRVRSPDRPPGSPRPGLARSRVPPPDRPRIVRAGCRRGAPVGRASARVCLARRAWRSLDSSPTRGPGRPGAHPAAAVGSAPSAPRQPRRRGRKGRIHGQFEILGPLR